MTGPASVGTERVRYPAFDGTQACASLEPELFFPKSAVAPPHPIAKAACARCPFVRPCLMYALVNLVDGIWGGTTRAQRDAIRAQHHIRGRAVALLEQGPTDRRERVQALRHAGVSPTVIADELGLPIGTVYDYLRSTT